MRFKRLSKKVAKKPTWVSKDWLFRIVSDAHHFISPYTLEVQSFLPGGPVKGPRSLTLPHWHTVGRFIKLSEAHAKAIEMAGLNR